MSDYEYHPDCPCCGRLPQALEELAAAQEALKPYATEVCREWIDADRCNRPAEFLLWGKMLPADALGPRCYDCAAKHVDHRALGDSQWAILDLRPALRAAAEGGEPG